MGVLTTLTTPIMLKWGFNRIDKAKRKSPNVLPEKEIKET
jgi:hypothetical protein